MRLLITILISLCSISSLYSQEYRPDILGANYLQRTIELEDDYEGRVVATLVKYSDTTRVDNIDTRRAILYIHGFNDYFFQKELAEKISQMGYNFYALDLRKYGRSYLEHQHRFNFRNVEEYFEEINASIDIINKEGSSQVVLMGHSTGGMTTTLYVYENSDKIDGLILNSPFYEQNQTWVAKNIGIPIISVLSYIFPNAVASRSKSNAYAQSLHEKYHGEWDYDLNMKLESNNPVYFSWLRAVAKAQNDIEDIENIGVPTLVMCSDKSTSSTEYDDSYDNSDSVLNVKDIEKHAKNMGENVEFVTIKDGIHDIALSKKSVRDNYYLTISNFLKRLN